MTIRNRFFSLIVASSFAYLSAACGTDRASSPGGPTSVDLAGSDDGSASAIGSGSGSGGSGGGGAAIRVRCRRDGTSRSKISVDGNNLAAGTYRARVTSGTNTALAGSKPTVGDEVEFDFDSNRGDIAAGATAISPTFIQGGHLTGQILNAGGAVVRSQTAQCEVR